MTPKAMILWQTIVSLLMVSNTMSEISQKTKDQVNQGISGGEKVVGFIASFGDPKTSQVFNVVGKMASFLGAAGGLISFALLFVPKSESAELKFMKKKFAEVNAKLDVITSQLDDVKALITYENQRAAYLDAASKILFGYKQLSNFLNELESTPCENEKNCKRVRARIASRYVNDFNVKKHIFKILEGATKKTSAFGDPFLSLIQKTFKCDAGKIDQFANSVLKLSFKAQQVILAYEKLLGSKWSITQSMSEWLDALYELRGDAYTRKKQCFNKISKYMNDDINDKRYQVNVGSNKEANQKVRRLMEKKYKWLGWVAYSYQAHGISKHCVTNVYGSVYGRFRNMPTDPNDRKRNLIVSFIDKSGTYTSQKYLVLNAIDKIVASAYFYNPRKDVCKVLEKFRKELKKKGVWKYVTSLNILRDYDGLVIEAANELTYISEEYKIKSAFRNVKVRVVIVLKSLEIANGVICDKSCGTNQGHCETLPYSSAKYCQCKPYYQGNNCEEHAEAQLAKTVDAMLATTLRLPTLSDVAYDIEDLREYVGISFGAVQSAISDLEASFKKAFDDLSRKLTDQFQWSNLITHYSDAIRKIEFYAYRFKDLHKRYPKTFTIEAKKLATAVLEADGIEKWLYELNFLFLGRTGTPLVNHKPLMVVFMNRHKELACLPRYKAAVDNAWRQLVLLQQMGFMVWAQALDIVGRPTELVAQLYKKRTAKQVSTFNQTTCQYSIRDSVNVQCSGGRYLHPAMSILNQCKENYYITGTSNTTCVSKTSGCKLCNCNISGSNSSECSDHSGKCSCNSGFYGSKCGNRDCVWGDWSGYSSCSKKCGYGGTKKKTRPHQVTKHGQGRQCNGSKEETSSCFNRCCPGKFHCSNRKKCIPSSYRCDYNNQCGDKQDEASCTEGCSWKDTGWNSEGGGNFVYFDRHRINCGGSDNVLKRFQLQRNHRGSMRFSYLCCRLNKHVCSNSLKTNSFSYDGRGNTVYLDRQTVHCGDHGYLNDFRLERNGAHNHVRYRYYCCNLVYSSHRRRTSCYTSYTGFTYDGRGRSYYLDRQTVQCSGRYFLTYFKLERGGNNRWRYRYRCCRITV